MSDRQPEAWETNEPRPFLTIDSSRGRVALSALGGDRFVIETPEDRQVVAGFTSARETARALGGPRLSANEQPLSGAC